MGKHVRIEVLTGGVQKDDGRGSVGIEFLKGGMGITDFGNFDRA